MARETKLYTSKEIEVTPFGIDLQQFRRKSANNIYNNDDIVVGTIKALEEKYGVEYLIRAFKIVVDRHPDLSLKLLIVGGGSLEEYLRSLVSALGLISRTQFTGKVPYAEVPRYHNMLSVSVFVSDSESFGVAIIEASACEKPVVVANVGGLPEVVEEGVTGLIVPPRNIEETALAIETLVMDKELRERMGKAGRNRVQKMFDWNNNVEQMISIYREIRS
jgi:glycosyltransferase involved in cell wall biosynthesis